MKKCIQIDNDISRKRSGAGGMKDVEASIIIHDQGVLCQWFAAVRAAFRETLNASSLSVFIGDDEHAILLSDLSRTSM